MLANPRADCRDGEKNLGLKEAEGRSNEGGQMLGRFIWMDYYYNTSCGRCRDGFPWATMLARGVTGQFSTTQTQNPVKGGEQFSGLMLIKSPRPDQQTLSQYVIARQGFFAT